MRNEPCLCYFRCFQIFVLFQEEIYGTAYAVAYYLKEILKFEKKVFTIGTTGMVEELDAMNIQHTGSGVGWIIFTVINSKVASN